MLTTAVPELRGELRFDRAWLIGSLAWGGFGPRSDVDLVVEGLAAAHRVLLADRLGESTGRSVDLLPFEELPPAFQARVLAEGHDVG
jgi:predicted nucleotidyltransferase